jgi:hypothetical protein
MTVPPSAPNEERVVPFTTEDGFDLNLINVRGITKPTRGPVILVHGAGVRANIFRAPVKTTIVDFLVDTGYDVWLENWRASIDFTPNTWTLDDAARYDHPAAVKTVLRETGSDSVKAVIHCQGSTSFAMSAVAGLLPEVDTIVTNAVSLHTVVPAWSRFKVHYALPVMHRFLGYYNPGWGDHPPNLLDKAITVGVKAVHHECNNTVCKLVSFTYGSGFPALWRHENLNSETHEKFIPREFGFVPLSFFEQMSRCVRAGHLVSYKHLDALPDDYVAQPPQTAARWVFLSGAQNRCFLPESQRETYRWFSKHRPGHHALHVFPGYSHLDIFMGETAATDIFPVIVRALEPD